MRKPVSIYSVLPNTAAFAAAGGNEAAQKRREFWFKVRISALILVSNAIVFFLVATVALR